MNLRHAMLRGAATVITGQVFAKLLSLATTVTAARLLGPLAWGIAATFFVVLTVLEMISSIATDRQVVQAKDGAEPSFLGTAHSITILRGTCLACVMIMIAPLMVKAFGHPEAIWAYRSLAIIPFVRGFSHFGSFVAQRDMKFRPTAILEIGPPVATVIIGIPLAWWLRDFSAALWILVIQTFARTIITHCVAVQPYRMSWNRGVAQRMMRFGWPLMANGIILYVVLQGDQTIVGAAYDMPTLGAYAAAFTIATVPTQMLAGLTSAILLPTLSRVQDNAEAFVRRLVRASEVMALSAGMVGILLIAAGPVIVKMLYGEAFHVGSEVISVLAAAWAIRLLRVVPNLAALAKSDTLNVLVSNIARCTGLVGALAAAWFGEPVILVAMSALVGEACAMTMALYLLSRTHGISTRVCGLPGVLTAGVLLMTLGIARYVTSEAIWAVALLLVSMTTLLVGTLMTACPSIVGELRGVASALWRLRSQRLV